MRGARWGIAGPWTPITQHKSVSHFNYIHAFASPIHCSHNQVSCRDLTPSVATIWTLLVARGEFDISLKLFFLLQVSGVSEVVMYDTDWCLDVRISEVFPSGHGSAVPS